MPKQLWPNQENTKKRGNKFYLRWERRRIEVGGMSREHIGSILQNLNYVAISSSDRYHPQMNSWPNPSKKASLNQYFRENHLVGPIGSSSRTTKEKSSNRMNLNPNAQAFLPPFRSQARERTVWSCIIFYHHSLLEILSMDAKPRLIQCAYIRALYYW